VLSPGSCGAWELEQASPSFDAALKALPDGIEQRDTAILSFIGVYVDWPFGFAAAVSHQSA
jgi:hypothetical protein